MVESNLLCEPTFTQNGRLIYRSALVDSRRSSGLPLIRCVKTCLIILVSFIKVVVVVLVFDTFQVNSGAVS